MNPESFESLDIDEKIDWEMAEILINKKKYYD
jgi:CMP-N-acetylneuraminic acid synthetase